MTVYEFARWSGQVETITADEVTFPGGALVFRSGGRIVLGVRPGDWNDLRDVVATEPASATEGS